MLEGTPNKRTAGERVLSIFADVQPGEGFTALLLTLNVFTLMTAYYVIKPVREALILSGAGAEWKSYAGAIQAGLFLLIVPLYSAMGSRVNRLWLINGLTAFFISNLAIFYVLGHLQVSLGIPFFLWVGLFSLLAVTQFWALANDVYSEEQGKRLFAIVGIGSSVGAIFGAKLAGWLIEPLGPYSMMLVTAGMLIVCMILVNWVHHREQRRLQRLDPSKSGTADQPLAAGGGFQLIFKYRYLALIAALVLLTNFVNTNGEFILGKTVSANATAAVDSTPGLTKEVYIGKFYADFFFWVNLLGAGLQLFVVSRIMKYLGVVRALFLLPLLALGSYTLLASISVLGLVRIVKILENSTDYSIQNTARHALFLDTNREAKYKAKTAIDGFFWRAGDGLSALLVFVGTYFALSIRTFAAANVALVVLWLIVVMGIRKLRHDDATVSKLAA